MRGMRSKLREAEARIRELEATLAEVYEAQEILARARRRAAREHLHLVDDQ
jgi:hypothetical protein